MIFRLGLHSEGIKTHFCLNVLPRFGILVLGKKL